MARIALNSNIASLNAQRYLQRSTSDLAKSFERLSSGLRINRASDDAAGLSISSLLDADSRVYSRAIQNINDAASALNIAEGSVSELSNVVVRLQELAEQSANGVYTLTQRRAMNNEANRLIEEFNRVAATTAFNGMNLLDPNNNGFRAQVGYGSTDGVISVGLTSQLRRGVGDGTFAATTSTSSGQATTADILTADVNGDSKLDLITANGSGSSSISILLGNGDGTFAAATSTALAGAPTYLDAGDYNGDGKVDLFASYGTSVAVLRGDGAGNFSTVATINAGIPTSDIKAGDFNNDGKSDFFVSTSGYSYLYVGDGNGNFTQAFRGNTGTLATGDFNGDGNLDIASGAPSLIYVYMGNGQGGLALGTTVNTGSSNGAIESADVNNDGLSDLILAPGSSTLAKVFTAVDGGTFGSAAIYSLAVTPSGNAGSSAVADINGDGFVDIMINGSASSGQVLLNDGTGLFTVGQTYTASSSITDMAYGDFNGDGAVDITSVTNLGGGSNINLLLGNRRYLTSMAAVNINSRSGALSALTDLRASLNRITSELGLIGASQSRLSAAFSNLVTSRDNFDSASSRIKDADVAEESAQLVRRRILQQAGAAILSQANEQPQIALQLLR